MSESEREFILTTDGDGHWYVIPADKHREASAYFEAVGKFWEDLEAEGDEPPCPEWIERIGGSPSQVRFTGYRVE